MVGDYSILEGQTFQVQDVDGWAEQAAVDAFEGGTVAEDKALVR